MNHAQLIAFINQWIYTNGNNEITAATLNPVLQAIANWANDVTGNPDDLNTGTNINLVAAINEINAAMSNINAGGVKLIHGITDPNEFPPTTFNIADFYILENQQGQPIDLYQYDGFSWVLVNEGGGGGGATYDGSNLMVINYAQGGAITSANQALQDYWGYIISPDEILSMSPLIIDGNEVTIPVAAEWVLNGQAYTNTEAWTTVVPLEPIGYKRNYLIVANELDTFELIAGVATNTGSAVDPIRPNNTLIVTTIRVDGESFDVDEPVVVGGDVDDVYLDPLRYLDPASFVVDMPTTTLTTPTYDGSGQATHPKVLHIPEGWNGYKYWMAFTPYPNGNDDFENPSILVSNDGNTWVVKPGATNPIEPEPTDGTYLADTHIVIGYDNVMYCYFRGMNPALTEYYLYVKSSVDGITWAAKQIAMTQPSGLGSPVVIKEKGGYMLFDIDFNVSPRKLYKRFSNNPVNFYSSEKIDMPYSGLVDRHIWHIDVHLYNNIYYFLLNNSLVNTNGAGGDLQIGISKDGASVGFEPTSVMYKNSATWNANRLYRSSFLPSKITNYGIEWDVFIAGVSASNVWKISRATMKSYFIDTTPDGATKKIIANTTITNYYGDKRLLCYGDVTLSIQLNNNIDIKFSAEAVSGTVKIVGNPSVTVLGPMVLTAGMTAVVRHIENNIYRVYPTIKNPLLSYDAISVATPNNNPASIELTDNGTKMIIGDTTLDTSISYPLTTPDAIATIQTPGVSLNTVAQDNNMSSGVIVNNGTKFITSGRTTSRIYEYSLSTPYLVSSGTYVKTSPSLALANPSQIRFNAAGTKMFIAFGDSSIIYQYSLTTPFDIATMTLSGQYQTGAHNKIRSFWVSNDEKTILAVRETLTLLNVIKLATAFDITTASLVENITIAEDALPWSITVNSNQTKVYILGAATKRIYQYSLNLNPGASVGGGITEVTDGITGNGTAGNPLGFNPANNAALQAALAALNKNVIRDLVAKPIVTGTTAVTTVATYTIPANTFASIDAALLFLRGRKSGAANLANINIYVNSVTTPNRLAYLIATATVQHAPVDRLLKFADGKIKMMGAATNSVNDNVSVAYGEVAFNPAVENTLICVIGLLDANDGYIQELLTLTKI